MAELDLGFHNSLTAGLLVVTLAVAGLHHGQGGKALEDSVQPETRLGHLRKPPPTGRGLFLSGFPKRRNDFIYNKGKTSP